MTAAARDDARPAALGCRAHTGWAAFVVVAGGANPARVVLRRRAELADPTGRVRRNVYQAARGVEAGAAAVQVREAERIAGERAAAELDRTVREAADAGMAVGACAVVVGRATPGSIPLESILASHALAHMAEGRLYQHALLNGADACGLASVPIAKRTIWDEGASALGVDRAELPRWLDGLRRELGPPWAEDQKLAALAAWIALAQTT